MRSLDYEDSQRFFKLLEGSLTLPSNSAAEDREELSCFRLRWSNGTTDYRTDPSHEEAPQFAI